MTLLLIVLGLPWLVIIGLVVVACLQRWWIRRHVDISLDAAADRLNAQAICEYDEARRRWVEGGKRGPPPPPPELWINA